MASQLKSSVDWREEGNILYKQGKFNEGKDCLWCRHPKLSS